MPVFLDTTKHPQQHAKFFGDSSVPQKNNSFYSPFLSSPLLFLLFHHPPSWCLFDNSCTSFSHLPPAFPATSQGVRQSSGILSDFRLDGTLGLDSYLSQLGWSVLSDTSQDVRQSSGFLTDFRSTDGFPIDPSSLSPRRRSTLCSP
ncbi:hypothetical protein PM082_020047 [Marasmius tenuissimus]|nr:hypothetical protein PM082_020047 [Marasmius tenuissimus]